MVTIGKHKLDKDDNTDEEEDGKKEKNKGGRRKGKLIISTIRPHPLLPDPDDDIFPSSSSPSSFVIGPTGISLSSTPTVVSDDEDEEEVTINNSINESKVEIT